MPAPRPCGFAPGWGQEWLQRSHLGWSCPTEVVRGGLSQTNGDRRVWGATSGHVWLSVLLHGAVTVSPWYNKWGLGFVHSQVEVLLLGTSPCSWR